MRGWTLLSPTYISSLNTKAAMLIRRKHFISNSERLVTTALLLAALLFPASVVA